MIILINSAYFTIYMNTDENKGAGPQEHSYPSRDAICTCKTCNHEIARDCLKSDCSCCKETDHSMIMDGIEGFVSTSKKHRLNRKSDLLDKGKRAITSDSYVLPR
jgi:hypothetical protein